MKFATKEIRPSARWSRLVACGLLVETFVSCTSSESNDCIEDTTCDDDCRLPGASETCVFVKGCLHSGHCPRATECLSTDITESTSLPDGGFSNCQHPDRADRVCTLSSNQQTRASDRYALTNGWHVDGFDLRPTKGETGPFAVLEWSVPDEATIVACALFICRPEVRCLQDDDRFVADIMNYEQCVVGSRVFQPASGLLDLESLDPYPSPSLALRHISTLLAGCWAFDGSRIIGATYLEPVSHDESSISQNLVDDECNSEVDNLNCQLTSPLSGYGTCFEGQCRPRCLTSADCPVLSGDSGPNVDADSGDDAGIDGNFNPVYRCDSLTNSYVGVCVKD